MQGKTKQNKFNINAKEIFIYILYDTDTYGDLFSFLFLNEKKEPTF